MALFVGATQNDQILAAKRVILGDMSKLKEMRCMVRGGSRL